MSSRESILANIRLARGNSIRSEPKEGQRTESLLAIEDDLQNPKKHMHPLPAFIEPLHAHPQQWTPFFCDQALKLGSSLVTTYDIQTIPSLIKTYLDAQNLPTQLTCWPEILEDLRLDWQSQDLHLSARHAHEADQIGLTGVFCAIAETGTLVFCSGEETPATNSLLPETHIALVPAERIVCTLEDAFQLIRTEYGTPPRAINFVSGPSRTADIEQTLVIGAHGPKRVHIIVYTNDASLF